MQRRSMKRCRSEDKVVALNVGGRNIKTRMSTLANGSTYFRSLFSGEWAEDSDDEIFVDRDPSLFHHVLQLMRSGNAEPVRRLEHSVRVSVLDEARFFGVPIPGRAGWDDWPPVMPPVTTRQYVLLQRASGLRSTLPAKTSIIFRNSLVGSELVANGMGDASAAQAEF